MKKFVIGLGTLLFIISCGKNNNDSELAAQLISENSEVTFESDEIDSDTHVLTPEEELEFITDFQAFGKATPFRFAQTTWKECTDPISGNFTGFNCASSRGISVILKDFINKHMGKCVNKGLAAQGGGTMADLHIVHAGILGDRNHSPRSLHAENRAIDIKSLRVTLTSGAEKTFTFSGSSSSSFFGAFRSCWGDIVKTFNNCPLFNGTPSLTGSIGKEDKNHQHHMHTSVPYCVGGSYSPLYFRK
jgi:hypothetical protein